MGTLGQFWRVLAPTYLPTIKTLLGTFHAYDIKTEWMELSWAGKSLSENDLLKVLSCASSTWPIEVFSKPNMFFASPGAHGTAGALMVHTAMLYLWQVQGSTPLSSTSPPSSSSSWLTRWSRHTAPVAQCQSPSVLNPTLCCLPA